MLVLTLDGCDEPFEPVAVVFNAPLMFVYELVEPFELVAVSDVAEPGMDVARQEVEETPDNHGYDDEEREPNEQADEALIHQRPLKLEIALLSGRTYQKQAPA